MACPTPPRLQDQLASTLHEPGMAPLMPHEDFDFGLFGHLQQSCCLSQVTGLLEVLEVNTSKNKKATHEKCNTMN